MSDLRGTLARRLGFVAAEAELEPHGDAVREDGFVRRAVRFAGAEGDEVPAWLLEPAAAGRDAPLPGVVVYHQHNRQHHLGKAEVAGLAGDPLQAFGPALARRGVVVLAPDSICFEDRRPSGPGTEPREGDFFEHLNEASYRLVAGRLLMTTVLGDAARALSALRALPAVDPARAGVLGHSYGGHVSLFHAALDERVRFAAASGAAASYRRRIADRTGIELAQVIPDILALADFGDLAALVAPRPLLLVSATADPHSADAGAIAETAAAAAGAAVEHERFEGGHALTGERFERIVEWVVRRA